MKDDEICVLIIRRLPGERTERIEFHVREGQDLVVCRALDATRRRMLGNTPGPHDPIFEDDEACIG